MDDLGSQDMRASKDREYIFRVGKRVQWCENQLCVYFFIEISVDTSEIDQNPDLQKWEMNYKNKSLQHAYITLTIYEKQTEYIWMKYSFFMDVKT